MPLTFASKPGDKPKCVGGCTDATCPEHEPAKPSLSQQPPPRRRQKLLLHVPLGGSDSALPSDALRQPFLKVPLDAYNVQLDSNSAESPHDEIAAGQQAAPLFRRRSLLPNVPLSQMDELCEQFCKVPLDEFYVHCGHHKRTSDCKICSDCGHGHVKSNCKICSNCGHGKLARNCIDCSGDCGHGNVKSDCKICSNCGHGKLARNCIDCSGDCGHGHVKSDCKICSNCGHGHVKSNCKICSDCGHGHLKSDCKICSNCGHGNVKRDCVVCNGCVHKRLPSNCPKCNPCLHGNVVGDCNRRRCLNCCRLTEVIGRRIVVVYEERKKKVEYAGEVVSAVIGELEVRFDGDDTLCPVYVGSNQKPDKGLEDDEYWWEAKKASKPPQGKGKRPAAAVPLSQVSEGAASGAKRRQR